MIRKFMAVAVGGLFACSTAQATVSLIAVGSFPGSSRDLSKATAATVESGVAGNMLGGMGSGLAYAGCNTFLAIPDRGPNKVSFNSSIDNTATYVNRFETVKMSLVPSTSGSLPFTLKPNLVGTTLLWTRDALVYGSGSGAGSNRNNTSANDASTSSVNDAGSGVITSVPAGTPLPSGAPSINTNLMHYFTGRSDNFDPATTSGSVLDGRFDSESIRVSRDGLSVYESDEYGPYIYRFNRLTGERTATYSAPSSGPSNFFVPNKFAVGNSEISGNTVGRVTNKGMEGLAISPDGGTLFGIMQSALLQDGGDGAANVRILKINLTTGAMAQYAYPVSTSPKTTVSDIVAINDHELLVDERDSKGLGDLSGTPAKSSIPAVKQLNYINLSTGNTNNAGPGGSAPDVSNLSGVASLSANALKKTLFLNVVGAITAAGFANTTIPSKLEGLAFGPDVVIGGVSKHTVFFANDNDFSITVPDSTGAMVNYDNLFYVFAFDATDLPAGSSGFVPQTISPALCR